MADRTPARVTLTLRTLNGEIEYQASKAKPKFNESTGDGVSWAAWTWNPITGCLHGCKYCYARAIAKRFPNAFPAGFEPVLREERLDAPANTPIPAKHLDDPAWKRVFVVSMGDMFGRWVPREWIEKVLKVEHGNPQWQYLHLTKFPDRYVEFEHLPRTAWIGTTVDEQNRVRIAERAFRQINNVAVKWLSLEPYPEEPLEFSDVSMFDWIVIGARTATLQPWGWEPAYAPPAKSVLRITHQAREAGLRVHWKPNLRSNPGVVGDLGPEWFDEYPAAIESARG